VNSRRESTHFINGYASNRGGGASDRGGATRNEGHAPTLHPAESVQISDARIMVEPSRCVRAFHKKFPSGLCDESCGKMMTHQHFLVATGQNRNAAGAAAHVSRGRRRAESPVRRRRSRRSRCVVVKSRLHQ
jgi:hypothetical protein